MSKEFAGSLTRRSMMLGLLSGCAIAPAGEDYTRPDTKLAKSFFNKQPSGVARKHDAK